MHLSRIADVVIWLLDTNPSTLDAVNHNGRTALHIAAASGHADISAVLVARGAARNPLMLTKVFTILPSLP